MQCAYGSVLLKREVTNKDYDAALREIVTDKAGFREDDSRVSKLPFTRRVIQIGGRRLRKEVQDAFAACLPSPLVGVQLV